MLTTKYRLLSAGTSVTLAAPEICSIIIFPSPQVLAANGASMQTEDAQATAPSPSTAAPSPRTDRLELLQQLSGGSVGLVHKARNPKLNRTVALRQLQVPEWLDDVDDLIKRILAEARAASALDHPNIARLYTGGYKGFTVFLTSEFVDGPNIREFVTSHNLGVAEIIALGKQLCAALDCAHQKKVLHNALTPANLKILPDGNLKVLDFGLLRDKHLYSPTPAKRLESEHYLSPEQLKNKPVTQATNVFAAATILYELLTTRNPFAGKHLGEVDRNVNEIDPTPASLAHTRVSESVSRVLMKALAKQPLARFQSCADFSAALEEALKTSPAKAGSSASSSAPPKPAAPAPAPKPTNTGQSVPAQPAVEHPAPAPKTSANGSGEHKPVPQPPPPPKAPAQARIDAPVTPPPNKMPAKMLTQWKLVGGIVAALFVVSAVAISFNHRSKVSVPAPEVTATPAAPAEANPQPTVAVPEIAEAPLASDVEEPHSRTRKQKTPGPTPATAAATDGQLLVSSDPAGAIISIDGRTMDSWKTPQTVGSLAPAVYKVTISKPGYAAETRNVQVMSGNRASLEVKLTALKAKLTVGGTPVGARIVIDGKETGKFSPAEFTLDPSVHKITLHREGFFDYSGEVRLVAGQSLNYSPSMTPAGRTDNIKVVGGFKKLFGGGSSAARIEIKTDPKGAQISINGTALSKTTPVEIQVEPGNYEITLQKEGYHTVHKTVTTELNDKVKIDEQLQK